MIQIPNYPNYFITETGKVYSTKRGKLKQMFGHVERDGYIVITLNCKGFFLHRLVATTFIPNPNNYPCVCHKDDNPANNCVDNLWWGTQDMNNKDRNAKNRQSKGLSHSIATTPHARSFSKLSTNDVLEIRYNTNGLTLKTIAERFNTSTVAIHCIKTGKSFKDIVK
jgi:hypothetical protein